MCVWIEADKLKDYFSAIIVSNTFQNYERTELKVRTKMNIFFKFRVESQQDHSGNKIYFELTDCENQ